ncbi:MAG TPA: hypothetical protein VJL80_06720 [Aeromicrobium sp.]|nr:hypothetical protein [Aeromicrobium sp.]HKY57712.1 hypothetical protein [Aeromicrobium sp.]
MSTPEPPPFPGDSTPESSGDLPSYGSVPPPPDAPGGPGGSVPPPPPPPPPAPPSYTQEFSPAEAIAWGWRKFTENTGPVILAMLVLLGVTLVLGFVSSMLGGGFSAGGPTPGEFQIESTGPGQFVAQLIQSAVSIMLGGVAAKAALEVTEGKPFDFFGAFGKVNIVQLLIAGVLVGIATLIGFVLLVIPGLIIMFLTYLTTYSIVDGDRSAIDGIKHSVKLISDNVGSALLLALLNILVVIAGAIALCVGLIVAIPVTMFATAYAYRSFNGQPVVP